MKKFVINYGYVLYSILLTEMALIQLKFQVEVISDFSRIISYGLFLMLTALAIYSLFNSQKQSNIIILFAVLSSPIMISSIWLALPVVAFLICIFFAKLKIWAKLPVVIIIGLIVIRLGLIALMGLFVSEPLVAYYSDDSSKIVVYKADQGALGVDFAVWYEKVLWNRILLKERLAVTSDEPIIQWISNDMITIDGKKYKLGL